MISININEIIGKSEIKLINLDLEKDLPIGLNKCQINEPISVVVELLNSIRLKTDDSLVLAGETCRINLINSTEGKTIAVIGVIYIQGIQLFKITYCDDKGSYHERELNNRTIDDIINTFSTIQQESQKLNPIDEYLRCKMEGSLSETKWIKHLINSREFLNSIDIGKINVPLLKEGLGLLTITNINSDVYKSIVEHVVFIISSLGMIAVEEILNSLEVL